MHADACSNNCAKSGSQLHAAAPASWVRWAYCKWTSGIAGARQFSQTGATPRLLKRADCAVSVLKLWSQPLHSCCAHPQHS
jgi:hypothetical protein